MTQNSVSFSCQNYPVSRCCINFPHELTCQILTNQSIKIGRRAWPTRDHGKKRSSRLYFQKAGWIFASEVSLKSGGGHSDKNTTHFIWIIGKNRLEPAISETINLSADNFKKVLDFDGSTLEPAVRSGDTGQWISCFDSCQLITTLMCNMQYQFAPGLPN